MASVRTRTRKDGTTYTSVLFREDGKQCSVSFDDHRAALRFQDLVERVGPDKAREIADIEDAHASEQTLAGWCTHHIDHLTGIEEGTRDRYKAYLANDIALTIGGLPLSAVTETAVASWVRGMEDAGASGKTVRNKHGFLSAALEAAVRAKRIDSNPCEGRRLGRVDKGKDTAVFLTPGEFADLRDAMTDRWQPLTTFLVSTGMRFSEATAITVGDIDAAAGTIRIVKAWKYTGTATRKLGAPKSKKGVRTISVPKQAIEAAGDLTRPRDALVFATQAGTPIRAQLYHNKAWRPALGALVVESGDDALGGKKPSPHDLRHTCASWMIAAGVPLPVIQAHLGHESITTTVGIYGHLDRASHAQGAAAIGAALGGA